MLTRSVGKDLAVQVDFQTVEVQKGDILVQCCDGLHFCVTQQEILEIVPSGESGAEFRTPKTFRRAFELDEIEELLEAYRAGVSIKDLTTLFDINRSIVLRPGG